MKKINKLNINPSKVITNDELIALKGGYGGGTPGYTTYVCRDVYNDLYACFTLPECNEPYAEMYCYWLIPSRTQMSYVCGNADYDCPILW